MSRKKDRHGEADHENWLAHAGIASALLRGENNRAADVAPAINWLEVEGAIRGLKQGDPTHLKTVLQFLERDFYVDGSGYLKEAAWKYLRRVPLRPGQQRRLQLVALGYVECRMTREFFPMCRTIRIIAHSDFQNEVHALTHSAQPNVKRRAELLAAYFISAENGELIRRKSRSAWRSYQYNLDRQAGRI